MAVGFLLGRAGTGKTQACLTAMRSAQTADPHRRLLLLVPEQASFQMERTLALPRGLWQAEVLSFSRLASRVLGQWIDADQLLTPAARPLALRMIVAREPDLVRHFGRAATAPGFFAALDRLFGEFFSEQITPAALADSAADLTAGRAERVAALGGLFERYLEWLGPERCDPGQRLQRLRARLPQADWLRDASVWVDGFAGFTAEERHTLVALAAVTREMTISLLLDPSDAETGDLFEPIRETRARLEAALRAAGIPLADPVHLEPTVPPRFLAAPPLAWLEFGLARQSAVASPEAPEPAGHVRQFEADTHRGEVEAAARHIRHRVLTSDSGVRFRDFALVTRDLEPFAALVADVFERYEIPYFLDRRRPLSAHGLATFLQTVFELLEHDFPPAVAERLLQLDLLPFERRTAEALGEQIRRYEVRGHANWLRPRWTLSKRRVERDEVAEARLRIARALTPLAEAAGAAHPAGTWAELLYQGLDTLCVPRKLEGWIRHARDNGQLETAAMHQAAWDSVVSLLDDLHAVAGPTPLTLPELAQTVAGALRDQTLGLAPPALDQVLVGAIDRTRHPDVRSTWLFAANEGIFPAPPGEDALLNDDDRERLAATGVPLTIDQRHALAAEPLLFYVAATRPAEELIVSHARFGLAGEELQPSPLLANLREVLPALEPEVVSPDAPPTCTWEFAGGYLAAEQRRDAAPLGTVRYRLLRDALTVGLHDSARYGDLLRGLEFDNRTTAIDYFGGPAPRDAPVWSGSISEIRAYQACPFRHFLKYGLGIPERVGPAPLNLELGNVGHDVLAEVVRRAIPHNPRKLEDPDWLAWLDEVARDRAAAIPDEIRQRRPDLAWLEGAVIDRLRETVLSLAERYRRGGFSPLHVEVPFGEPSSRDERPPVVLPALRIDLARQRYAEISGYIDRIDQAEHDGRRLEVVADYKPQADWTRTGFLTNSPLQLLTYALARAQQLGKDGVAAALLVPLYLASGKLDSGYVRESKPREQCMHGLKPRGIFRAEHTALLHAGLARGERSPVVYLRIKADGEPESASDALPTVAFDTYLELTRVTLRDSLEGITGGSVAVAPLVEKNRLACRYCTYKPVCRFERVFRGARPAGQALPQLADAEPYEDPPCS